MKIKFEYFEIFGTNCRANFNWLVSMVRFIQVFESAKRRHLLKINTNHIMYISANLSTAAKWLRSILLCICLIVAIQCEWLLPLHMQTPMSNARGTNVCTHTDIRHKNTNHTLTYIFDAHKHTQTPTNEQKKKRKRNLSNYQNWRGVFSTVAEHTKISWNHTHTTHFVSLNETKS